MRMLISSWIACSQIWRSNQGFLGILLRVSRIVRLEYVLLVDLLPLRTLLVGQRSHRVDAGALNQLVNLAAGSMKKIELPAAGEPWQPWIDVEQGKGGAGLGEGPVTAAIGSAGCAQAPASHRRAAHASRHVLA